MNKMLLLVSCTFVALGALPAAGQSLSPTQECPPTTATGTTGSATGPGAGASGVATDPAATRSAGLPDTGTPATPATPQNDRLAAAQTDCPRPPSKSEAPKQ